MDLGCEASVMGLGELLSVDVHVGSGEGGCTAIGKIERGFEGFGCLLVVVR